MKHLGWYLHNKIINLSAGRILAFQVNDVIKKLSPQAILICNAFGIPEHQLLEPIYTGYQDYYRNDFTNGEHHEKHFKPKF